MKITVLQENLEQKLSLVTHIVSQKSQLPILSHVLIKAKDNEVTLFATDLEIGTQLKLGAKVEEEGEIAVPVKILFELVSSLPYEKVTLYSEKQNLFIESPKTKSTILGTPTSEFPKIFEGEKIRLGDVENDSLKSMLEKVCFAASMDEGRPALTGVLMNTSDGLSLVATDGYRLSLQKSTNGVLKKTGGEGRKLLIPVKLLKHLTFFLSGKEKGEKVSFFVSKEKKQIIVTVAEDMLVGRLIDEAFPPFEKIIPTQKNTMISLDKEEFMKAVKTCSIFARESAHIVKMKVEKGGVTLSANAAQVGENSVTLDASVSGEENEAAFNSRFLLEFLSNVPGKEIVFEMTGPLSPGVFKIKDDDSFLHIIMPVRIQAEPT